VWRTLGRSFLELLGLTGLAVALPLLDVFGRAPTQFTFRDAGRTDIVAFGLVVTFALPLSLWLVELALRLVSARVARGAHVGFVALLVGAFAVQACRGIASAPWLHVLAGVVAVAGTALYVRSPAAGLWVRFTAAAPPVLLALFLIASDTSVLLRDPSAPLPTGPVGAPAPVVVLVFDELPLAAIVRADGTIDDDRYPHLASLAGRSHWFRNTTAVASSTWYAVPSLVTGRLPEDGDAPVAQDHPDTLFSLLSEVYDLRVSESVTRLCPADLCRSSGPAAGGLDALLGDAGTVMRDRLSPSGASDDPTADMVEATADLDAIAEDEREPDPREPEDDDPWGDFERNQPERFRTFVDGLGGGGPTLDYLHLLMPHVPYRYLPSGARYEPPDPDLGRGDDRWDGEPWYATLARQRLQQQLAYADQLVGDLVAALDERGTFDDSLVVVTADHGIAFEPGLPIRNIEGQALDDATVGQLAWVPLLVKEPGQGAGTVSDANVLTVDVVPTIADVLDVEVPWEVDGRSALGAPRSTATKPFHRSDVNQFGVESLPPVEIDEAVGWRSVTGAAVDGFFAHDDPGDARWHVGEDADLVGRRTSDAGIAELTLLELTLDDADRYELDGDARLVPALVQGDLARAVPGDPLAIAVNGVISGVAPAYAADGAVRFAAMVDDGAFRTGSNEITVHRIGRT
jgi:hypothetical protein